MTPATAFAGQRIALFGLGGSGLATAEALVAGGAEVAAWDDSAARVEAASARGVPTADLRVADWSGFAVLVLAPGVPLTHPAPHWTVERAHAAGVGIIGDIEIFCRQRAALAPDAPFVAITGTNGKSTTTTLIAHILREVGRDVQMGGNIGTPILSLAPPAAGRVHVIELSSFQIDLTPSLKPSIGVLLNVTPDHLDRHGTMAEYAAIKERLVMAADLAIICPQDDYTAAIAACRAAKGPVERIVVADETDDKSCAFATILAQGRRLLRGAVEVADLTEVSSLRGAHNMQNAAAAFAVCSALGMADAAIAGAIATYPGLAHRMEEVGRAGSVIFVNDSKATNADSTEKALLAFPGGIHWIVGGTAKEGGIAPLAPLFGRVARAYLIGASTENFAATLATAGVPCLRCGTIDRALAEAAADAAQSSVNQAVVLLSPACASYDQFPNFEVRGDEFRRLVRERLASAAPEPAR